MVNNPTNVTPPDFEVELLFEFISISPLFLIVILYINLEKQMTQTLYYLPPPIILIFIFKISLK